MSRIALKPVVLLLDRLYRAYLRPTPQTSPKSSGARVRACSSRGRTQELHALSWLPAESQEGSSLFLHPNQAAGDFLNRKVGLSPSLQPQGSAETRLLAQTKGNLMLSLCMPEMNSDRS